MNLVRVKLSHSQLESILYFESTGMKEHEDIDEVGIVRLNSLWEPKRGFKNGILQQESFNRLKIQISKSQHLWDQRKRRWLFSDQWTRKLL